MKVLVETPKWSFIKYRHVDGKFVTDFLSPLPTLFNYGYIMGSVGADGMPKDAILLGPRLRQGTQVDANQLGTVYFTDDGVEDDKVMVSVSRYVRIRDMILIHLFFTCYMVFKTVYYLITQRRLTVCRYGGFSLLQAVR
jgi:inorganic pyrophosphatase